MIQADRAALKIFLDGIQACLELGLTVIKNYRKQVGL